MRRLRLYSLVLLHRCHSLGLNEALGADSERTNANNLHKPEERAQKGCDGVETGVNISKQILNIEES